VQTRWEAHNQNGELVLTVDSAALFGLRNPVDPGASAA